MDSAAHAELIRTFMVAIAPEVTHHRLSLIRHHLAALAYDQIQVSNEITEHAASDTAKLALEWSMHLAAQYISCYDLMLNEAKPAQTPEQKASTPIAPVQRAKDKIPD